MLTKDEENIYNRTTHIPSSRWQSSTEILISWPAVPPSGSLVIILFFIVRRQERDCGQVFIFCSDAPHDAKSMNLAVYARAAALLDGNLDVSVILWDIIQVTTTLILQKTKLRSCQFLSLKPTNLSTVTKEKDSGVCGIDVYCLQLNQVVQRASTCILRKKHFDD